MASKKFIKSVDVTAIGDKQNCGHCRQADSEAPGYVYIANRANKYEYVDLKSERADAEIKRAAKILNKPVKKLDSIPIMIYKVTECDDKACSTREKVKIGYDREEFKRDVGLSS